VQLSPGAYSSKCNLSVVVFWRQGFLSAVSLESALMKDSEFMQVMVNKIRQIGI